MKSPELLTLQSPWVDAKLLFDANTLVPSPNDLSLLTNRLGLKSPNTLTVALQYSEEQHRELEPHFNRRHSLNEGSQAPGSSDVLRVSIEELTEQDILQGLAHSLVIQAWSKRRQKAVRGALLAIVAETGVGSIIQQAGSYWGLAAIPVVAATIGGMRLWLHSQRNIPPVPSLDGLESPIKIRPMRPGK